MDFRGRFLTWLLPHLSWLDKRLGQWQPGPAEGTNLKGNVDFRVNLPVYTLALDTHIIVGLDENGGGGVLLTHCGSGETKGISVFWKAAWKIPDLTSCHAGGGILSKSHHWEALVPLPFIQINKIKIFFKNPCERNKEGVDSGRVSAQTETEMYTHAGDLLVCF